MKLNRAEKKLLLFVLVPILVFGAVVSIIIICGDMVNASQAKTVFELKESAKISDLFVLSDKNATMKTEDGRLDTDTVGNKTITVEFEKNGGHVVNVDFSYEVVDTTAPTLRVQAMTIIIGTDFDPLMAIAGCQDFSEITLSYGGTYDVNVAGRYPLTVTATDAYGNATTQNYVLTVIDSEEVDGVVRHYFRTSKGFLGYTDAEGFTYIDGCLIVNKTYSFPADYKAEYSTENAPRNVEYLDKTVAGAYRAMWAQMHKEGLSFWMQSGLRTYSIQEQIYNSYVKKYGKAKADSFSARPGYSEHETGLCFDVNTVETFETNYPTECKWLMDHAWEYGFILRYPEGKTNETGYDYEPWHYRYVGKELAQILWNNGDWLTIEDYFGITSEYAD